MATIEYWIQIENHAWDVAPNNIDRITGEDMQMIPAGAPPVVTTLTSPVSGVVRNNVTMYKPLSEDALILRRYTANWMAPDDRKVNPWDINESDPTDTGTMGTIPGPVIECSVGDEVIVHFRNMDTRIVEDVKSRSHSLHPHGFVFSNRYDGAYPLSPPDPTQPVGGEAGLWALVGVTSNKRGDRVPPGATFDYHWSAPWPTNAGIWLYHDHSICDMDNVQLGAIGITVIHNTADPDDVIVDTTDLPGGSYNGSPTRFRCFPFPFEPPVLPHDLDGLGLVGAPDPPARGMGMMLAAARNDIPSPEPETTGRGNPHEAAPDQQADASYDEERDEEEPELQRSVIRENVLLELDDNLQFFRRLCFCRYRTPPTKAQYLLLFHNLGNASMCINGRKFLGNTPTVIAGLQSRMRFGIVGMGNFDGFHTFHLHGHRWIIPGPDGNDPTTIENSVQTTAISQFEDTRTFGPANSFGFTIRQGSFMGSIFGPAAGLGEWHMHCHVLNHMMDGMMGSMLVIQGGELCLPLAVGEPCGEVMPPGGGGAIDVNILGGAFDPPNLMIMTGQTVRWTNILAIPHTVTSNPGSIACSPTSTEAFASPVLSNVGDIFEHTFTTPGTFAYHCEVHGCGMAGTLTVM